MPERLKHHFEPQSGWMNDPNGLIFFKGEYHAFFQHNPYDTKWGPMHWGHAVSEDLIHWQELPIALSPDEEYENDGGCFSGSAVEKDGILFLFYTGVSKKWGQAQCVVTSRDGIHFEKYADNPVIRCAPPEGSRDFRDPKVTKISDKYYMVCGTGKNKVGKVVFYSSTDLFDWQYEGVLYEGTKQDGSVLECPDFFAFGDKYLLLFSRMGKKSNATAFVYGDFDGKRFTPISFSSPEAGPHFYAPQTFLDDKGRRILIAWLYSWDKLLDAGATYAGALTIPREIFLSDGKIALYPVEEALPLLVREDPLVQIQAHKVTITAPDFFVPICFNGKIDTVDILRDSKTIEVFVNHGEASFTYWFTNAKPKGVLQKLKNGLHLLFRK